MPKNTEEDKEKLKEKLTYLGLNLERIPKFLKDFNPFSFRPSKSYDDTSYKVYQYININDIQILLTPTDRLTDLNEKYKLAAPLSSYLDTKSEANIERFATFLKMLNEIQIEDIEKIEKEQDELKERIPYKVKYQNNYIWQIYYSDVSEQYFMLVPTNELNNSAFFYLLKKQIESSKTRKKEYIYVPITHQEYSGNFLVKSQMTDLENYLWYFTKEWPNIFELYDLKGKMSLKIVGKTNAFRKVESDYVIHFENKEKALEWYKLIKALFILATGLPDDYSFQVKISEDGGLEFIDKEENIIDYVNLPHFIKQEVYQKKIQIELQNKKILEQQEKLQELKEVTEKQTEEYLNKQCQIATFLACKKSFFGKIKYYFGNRKKTMPSVETLKRKTKKISKQEDLVLEEIVEETKKQYTIEDLIEICTKLDGRNKMNKNLELDGKALELKKVNLERKIKNANIYLNEIELHKKSIFEFWKFTNKDELPSLNEGEEELDSRKEKIGKSFEYEEDIEDLGKQMDEIQRRKLSKNETDSIFAVRQVLNSFQILNQTLSKDLNKGQKEQLEKQLENLKKEYEKNIETIQIKDFDIFGGISDDKTKIKLLHNEKHREIEKDKYKILSITPETTLELYIDNIRNYLNLIKEAYHKITTPFEMPIYLVNNQFQKNNLNVFNLNATQEIYQKIEENRDERTLELHIISLPENMAVLYYTNIIFFDNFNQTLPLGMDLSNEVLVDFKNYAVEPKEEKDFRVNYQLNEYENRVIPIHVIEYEMRKKI